MSWAETKTIWDRIESARSSLASTLSGIATNASTAATNASTAATNAANAQLSSTRLGYIDRIANGTYGLDKIQALVATNNTAANNGTLSQKLSYIINNGVPSSSISGKIIKSIQRITTHLTSSSKTVTITSVDVNKTIIVLNGFKTPFTLGSYGDPEVYAILASATSVTVGSSTGYGGGAYYGSVYFQVVEFY